MFHQSKELNHEMGRDSFQETGPPTQSVGGGNSQGGGERSLESPLVSRPSEQAAQIGAGGQRGLFVKNDYTYYT